MRTGAGRDTLTSLVTISLVCSALVKYGQVDLLAVQATRLELMCGTHGQVPALERALPGQAVPGSWQSPRDTSALVLLTDGTWAELDIRGWRKDTRDRWCIELRWYETGVSEMSDWYVFDRGRIKSLLTTAGRVAHHGVPADVKALGHGVYGLTAVTETLGFLDLLRGEDGRTAASLSRPCAAARATARALPRSGSRRP